MVNQCIIILELFFASCKKINIFCEIKFIVLYRPLISKSFVQFTSILNDIPSVKAASCCCCDTSGILSVMSLFSDVYDDLMARKFCSN